VLGLVQLGVWLHARTVASQAAAVAADLSSYRSVDAEGAGTRVAVAGGLQQVSISTVVDGDFVVVTVSGRAPLFFDLGQGQITEKAVAPREVLR
jgi:3-keto-L-gulonate-6-phosphate decarboxylase